MPRGRGEDRVGVTHLPDGAAIYASQIRRHTSLEWSAEEIHRVGSAESERIDGEIRPHEMGLYATELDRWGS